MRRKCDYCGRYYDADKRNLNRGWGFAVLNRAPQVSARNRNPDTTNSELNETIGDEFFGTMRLT